MAILPILWYFFARQPPSTLREESSVLVLLSFGFELGHQSYIEGTWHTSFSGLGGSWPRRCGVPFLPERSFCVSWLSRSLLLDLPLPANCCWNMIYSLVTDGGDASHPCFPYRILLPSAALSLGFRFCFPRWLIIPARVIIQYLWVLF